MIGRAAVRIGLAFVAAIGVGCGDGYSVEYEGVDGRPTEAAFDGCVPSIDVSIDGAEPLRFLIDTGAPLTMIDTDSYPQVPVGQHRVEVGGFGLAFPDRPVAATNVFSYEQDPDTQLHGILGGDILSGFALSLDYQNGRAWLTDGLGGDLPDGVDASLVQDAGSVPADVLGGGRASLPTCILCGTFDLPATRFLVDVSAESSGTFTALVDTGASLTVFQQTVLDDLGDQGRPRLEGVTVATANGIVTAYVTRVGSLRLEGTDALEQTSAPVLVLPDESLFASLEAEVGIEVDAIIGASFLREFLTTMDYQDEALDLARYTSRDHIDDDEYVGVGFTVVRGNGGALEVETVYPDTDAETQGLVAGEAITELAGQPASNLTVAQVQETLDALQVGELVTVGVQRGAEVVVVDVAVEDLLPPFEGP